MKFNESGSKYLRAVPCITEGKIDVYAVLDAFSVTCPARQHAIKKLLCSGIRGKGGTIQDLREAADAVRRAVQMEEQRLLSPDLDAFAAAIADVKRDMGESFRLDPDHPLAREKHKDPAPISGQYIPSLCPSCQRETGCIGDYPATKDGGCEGYIKAEKESLCKTCGASDCKSRGGTVTICWNHTQMHKEEPEAERKASLCESCDLVCSTVFIKQCGETGECGQYTPATNMKTPETKQKPPTAAVLPLDFTLPSITLKCTAEEALAKYHSEVREWGLTVRGTEEELIERWDCLQAIRTYAERGGDVADFQHHVKPVMHDLTRYYSEGRDVMGAKAAMLIKNAGRGYYMDGVNVAIINSKGHDFTPEGA